MKTKKLIVTNCLFALIMLTVTLTSGQDLKSHDAKKTADSFVASFWQNLDFNVPFRAFSDKEISTRVRNTKILEQFGLDRELLKSFSDEELLTQYSNALNVHFLTMAYFEQNPKKMLPEAIVDVYKSSRFQNSRMTGGETPFILTSKDADDYLQMNRKVSKLLQARLRAQKPEKIVESDYVSLDGNPDLCLSKGKPIYYFRRGFFSLTLMETNGTFRIVDIGLGS